MFELNGKHNTAKVFTDNCEQEAVSQIINLLNQESMIGSNVRIMPDVHAGAGCTIGTTMTITDKIIPNLVGVDIGCGMLVCELGKINLNLEKLDKTIHKHIPSGFAIHDKANNHVDNINLNELCCVSEINLDRAEKSIGTLGGGNHFIEANKDENDNFYLVIHTGSRHLGLEIAKFYQSAAYDNLCLKGKCNKQAIINAKIAELKSQNRITEIESELEKLSATPSIPKELAYCKNELFDNYIHDMKIAQDYAMLNRFVILEEILKNMNLSLTANTFTTVHNYIDMGNMILRKGAVSAQKNEKLIIPMNMRDGSLICIGKGNSDWNYSAPHGAGRTMSRSKAKSVISLDEFEKSMNGIYSTSINNSTIDEAPMAYKSMDEIIENIKDTVEIQTIIKPVYNFKASV